MQLFYLACTEDSALGLSRALQLASYFYSETLPGPPFNFEALDDISDLLVPVHALHRVRSLLSRDAQLYYYYSTTSTKRFGGDAFEDCKKIVFHLSQVLTRRQVIAAGRNRFSEMKQPEEFLSLVHPD